MCEDSDAPSKQLAVRKLEDPIDEKLATRLVALKQRCINTKPFQSCWR